MTTTRVGLVLGADATQFRTEMQKAGREIEKLERIAQKGQRKGVLSKQEARDYDTQLKKVTTSVRSLSREYQFVTNEIRRMEQEQKKLLATGQKVSLQQKQQLAELKTAARSQYHAMQTAQGNFGAVQSQRAGMGTQGALGALAGRYFAPTAAIALATGVFSWTKGKMDAGESTLIENMMGRMGSERLTGRDPQSKMWRSARVELERYGRSLAYTTAETHNLYQMGAKAVGIMPRFMARQNLAMMRGYNLDPGALFGYQGAFRHAGGFIGGGDPNVALVRGMKLGGFARALSGEMAQSLSGLLSTVASSGNDSIKAGVLPGLMGVLGRTMGGVYKESPQRTATLLQGLHRTMGTPGGGEAGQAFMLRAFGIGSGAKYEDVLERMGEGISNPQNLRDMMSQISKEYKGREVLALHRLSGGAISIKQAKRLSPFFADPSRLSPEAIEMAMKGQQVDIGGEAAKSRAGTALVRRKIQTSEAEAALRGAGDPAYSAAKKIELAAMEALTNAINALVAVMSLKTDAAMNAIDKGTNSIWGTAALTGIGMGPIAIQAYVLKYLSKVYKKGR